MIGLPRVQLFLDPDLGGAEAVLQRLADVLVEPTDPAAIQAAFAEFDR